MNDILLEPLKAYTEHYSGQFLENAGNYFDRLKTESGIDEEQNRSTVKAYEKAQRAADEKKKILTRLRAVRGILIFLAVAGLIAGFIGIYQLLSEETTLGTALTAVGFTVAGLSAVLIFALLNSKVKNAEEVHREYQNKADGIKNEAWVQMQPLNRLFEGRATKDLIEATVPEIKIDDNFDMKRFSYFRGKYGFTDNDNENESTTDVLSGEIAENPFAVIREFVMTMGTEIYTGSITIHWTTTYTDSKGQRQTQHHTEVLTASVTKPKPFYDTRTWTVYGNDSAPNLSFSRKPSHAERLSEKEIERRVKSGVKKIKKQQEKALKSGQSNFTEMGNEEFDVLFGALDRNNEVQFRLLFTPLAQKSMLELMKSTKGYGDDFYFTKKGCLNFIASEHSADWNMDTSPDKYRSYDVDKSKNDFISFNSKYFKSLYFDLAPLLSIPIYQQQKPTEYVAPASFARNFTSYEAERLVNRIGQASFAPEGSATPSILKVREVEKRGNSDKINVHAYSFRTVKRVDFIPRFGGDGRMHEVPVPWVEYIPISRETTVNVGELSVSERDFNERKLGSNASAFGSFAFTHRLFGSTAEDGDFDNIVKNFK